MWLHSRNLTALMLSIIVVMSAAQTAGIMPKSVSADNTLSLRLLRAPTSTESIFASGDVKVNIESGQLTIELRQVFPKSVYEAFFVFSTSGTNIQLGNVATGNEEEGHLETTLSYGTYLGIFQILRLGLPQFVSASTPFTIGLTATATEGVTSNKAGSSFTTTSATTSTSPLTSVTQTASATAQVQFRVEPASRTINTGDIARFNIHIYSNGTASVLLAAKGIPHRSTAIFTQYVGVASPEFHSDLIVVTSDDTPIGAYSITVISLIKGQEFDVQVTLQVASSSTTTIQTNTSTTVTVGLALDLSLSIDRHHYEPNATVNLQGQVFDEARSAVADATVLLQVDGPTGGEIIFSNKTDTAGVFRLSFRLLPNATAGTYTAFVSATKSGYPSATTHTSFVVTASATPSVVIDDIYATDISGNRSAIFSAGQTALVWVVVENSGATVPEGVIWVQIRDANGTPIWIDIHISPLATNQTVKVAFSFQVTSGMKTGLYAATALVSDKLISQGGTFFATANTEFAVTL
jgi:hypothetical protein